MANYDYFMELERLRRGQVPQLPPYVQYQSAPPPDPWPPSKSGFYRGAPGTPEEFSFTNIPEVAQRGGLRAYTLPEAEAIFPDGSEYYGKPLNEQGWRSIQELTRRAPSASSLPSPTVTQDDYASKMEMGRKIIDKAMAKGIPIAEIKQYLQMKGYDMEPSKPMEVEAGKTVIDPRSGKVIYKAEERKKEEELKIGGTKESLLGKIARGETLTDAENEAWRRIEAVELAGAKETAKSEARTEVEKKVSFPKVKATMSSLENQWDSMDSFIDTAIKQVTPFSAGAGAWSSVLPLTPARNLAATLSTIAANVGFDKLQDMRQNSPTGGALGQVSDFENKLLQAVQGSLEQGQSPRQLVSNLNNIKALLKLTREQKRAAFQQDFGRYEQPGVAATGGAGGVRKYNPATGGFE